MDNTIVDVNPEEDAKSFEDEGENLEKSEGENLKSKELQSALAQKEHWRKKFEDLAKSVKPEVKPEKTEKPVNVPEDEWREKVEFLVKNRDYNEDEYDHISTVAKRKGVGLKEAAEMEKDYINFQREKVAEKTKTPSPSQSGFSSYDKKITPETPPEEVDRILEERAKKGSSGY
jgi:Rieske Fe-S protein